MIVAKYLPIKGDSDPVEALRFGAGRDGSGGPDHATQVET